MPLKSFATANRGRFLKEEQKRGQSNCSKTDEIKLSASRAKFELPGEDAVIRKEGERLIIEVAPRKSLLAVLATLSPLDEDFPPISDPVPSPVDL
jgi:antitoxin VapB